MDIKVIYSSGGKFNKKREQKIADEETLDGAKMVAKALMRSGHTTQIVKITPGKIGSVGGIKADAVFNLVEWSGKDYPLAVRVLKNLEAKGLPYTGADSKSYEWCCDKISMKKMFDAFGIPTPEWTFANPKDSAKSIREKVAALPFPIIIKPAYEHCAIGIGNKSVIHSEKESIKRIASLLEKYNEPVIIEHFIKGREFTTTVIKNHKMRVFPPAEVVFDAKNPDRILSFDTKWADSGDSYDSVIIGGKISGILKKLSRVVFKKMGCRGYVRIDFRMDREKLYVLEVNINPSVWPEECYGLTVSTEEAGWSFEKLVNEIALSALTADGKN